mmetsp:Transcript_43239/g.125016  ORF Transcript_43239/g.125016 Transcript_43239/m.125016 type:complete len:260 (+) Transcript_43239:778-1557(+)
MSAPWIALFSACGWPESAIRSRTGSSGGSAAASAHSTSTHAGTSSLALLPLKLRLRCRSRISASPSNGHKLPNNMCSRSTPPTLSTNRAASSGETSNSLDFLTRSGVSIDTSSEPLHVDTSVSSLGVWKSSPLLSFSMLWMRPSGFDVDGQARDARSSSPSSVTDPRGAPPSAERSAPAPRASAPCRRSPSRLSPGVDPFAGATGTSAARLPSCSSAALGAGGDTFRSELLAPCSSAAACSPSSPLLSVFASSSRTASA